jgi:hypothetical protein
MIRCTALVLLLVWSAAAGAVSVRKEEHDGYSRLVFSTSSDVRWRVNQSDRAAAIEFDNAAVDRPYLYGDLTGGRLSSFDVDAKGAGRFATRFSLSCNCSLNVSVNGRYMAVDIVDAGASPGAFAASDSAPLPRLRPGALLAAATTDNTAAPAVPMADRPAVAAGPVPRPRAPALSESELRIALAHQISEAVEAGLLTPAGSGNDPSGKGAAPAKTASGSAGNAATRLDGAANKPEPGHDASSKETAAIARDRGSRPPSGNVQKPPREREAVDTTDTVDRAVKPAAGSSIPAAPRPEAVPAVRERVLAAVAECLALPTLPAFDPEGFDEAMRLTRSELVGEFDQADPQRLEHLSDLYLVHGLFTEALRLLAMQPESPRQRAAIRLARAADGNPAEPLLSGCDGPPALVEATERALTGRDEAALSAFARSAQAAGVAGYLRTALLVPVLDAAIRLKRGDLAQAIFDQAWSDGEQVLPEAAIRQAQIARLTGDTVQERRALQVVAGTPARERDDALLRLVELDLAEGRTPAVEGLVEILSEKPRDSRALLLLAKSRGTADAWGDALSYADAGPLLDALNAMFSGAVDERRQLLSAAIEPSLPARLSERPQIAEFLGHALLAAGLPEQAARYGVQRSFSPMPAAPTNPPQDPLEGADKLIEQVTQFLEKPANG